MDNLQPLQQQLQELQPLKDLQECYRMMKVEGGEPMADQLKGYLAAEINLIDQYGGALAPALCRAPMRPELEEKRLNRLVTLWGEINTTGIVYTRVLKRTIGDLTAAAAAAPLQPWLRLLLAQLLRIYLVSQVTGNVDSNSKMSRPKRLQGELQKAMQLQLMHTETHTADLQTLFVIGTEFVKICSQVCDLYE